MKTNKAGIELIKRFEGLRLDAYRCPAGVLTIGYGHTSMAGSPRVTPGLTISEDEAEQILIQDLKRFEAGVAELVTVPTNENQFSALVSFSYNTGVTALRHSTLLKLHNQGDFEGAARQFAKWVYAGGRVLPGLANRREAEEKLYRRSIFAGASTSKPTKTSAESVPATPVPTQLPLDLPDQHAPQSVPEHTQTSSEKTSFWVRLIKLIFGVK